MADCPFVQLATIDVHASLQINLGAPLNNCRFKKRFSFQVVAEARPACTVALIPGWLFTLAARTNYTWKAQSTPVV
jgi:hypothetical protein